MPVKYPKPIKKGPKWLQKGFEERDKVDKQISPSAGAGITIDQTSPDSSKISTTSEGGGSGAAVYPAFSLYDASDELGFKIGVDNGFVGSELPSGMTPGATRGSAGAYKLGVSGTGVVYLHVTVNSETGAISSVVIGYGTSVPSDDETNGYCAIGDYSTASGALSIGSGKSGVGNLGYIYSGGYHYFYRQ